jgi:hypothetical protein
MKTTTEKILNRVRESGVLRPWDLEDAGIPGTYLARLARRGLLLRIGRGLFTLPGAPAGEHHSLAEAATRVPRGVVCLLSALRYHGLTTQSPFEVWMAIGEKDRRPKGRRPSPENRSLFPPSASSRRRHSGHRRRSRAHLHSRQDRRRLLQVPQQDRHRRRDRGAQGLPTAAPVPGGRACAVCSHVSCLERDAAVHGSGRVR